MDGGGGERLFPPSPGHSRPSLERKMQSVCAARGLGGGGKIPNQTAAWEHPCEGGKLTSPRTPASTPSPVADSCKASSQQYCDIWKGRGSVSSSPSRRHENLSLGSRKHSASVSKETKTGLDGIL